MPLEKVQELNSLVMPFDADVVVTWALLQVAGYQVSTPEGASMARQPSSIGVSPRDRAPDPRSRWTTGLTSSLGYAGAPERPPVELGLAKAARAVTCSKGHQIPKLRLYRQLRCPAYAPPSSCHQIDIRARLKERVGGSLNAVDTWYWVEDDVLLRLGIV